MGRRELEERIEKRREDFVRNSLLSDEFIDFVQENLKPVNTMMAYYQCAIMEVETKFKVLKHRLNTAIDYLEKNPETICIVSGGQGYNEPCTEAQAMADYMEAAGIEKDRLILEDESKTTEQNIKYSKKYMKDGASVGIITNDFHMFRAMQITKGEGLKSAKAIAAGSNPLYLPNNMFREYLAEWKYLIRSIL